MTGPATGPVVGVILAGGRSLRMGGGDKCLLPLGGRPILARVIARMAPQVDVLAINANGPPGRFAAFGLPVIADSVPGFAGPLAGVLAGMDWAAARGAPLLATAPADTPFLPATLVAELAAARAAAGARAAMAMTDDPERGLAPHPTFGLWDVALREDLRAALASGMRRMAEWAARQDAACATFRDQGAPFFNVNRPEDLARAEAMLATAAG